MWASTSRPLTLTDHRQQCPRAAPHAARLATVTGVQPYTLEAIAYLRSWNPDTLRWTVEFDVEFDTNGTDIPQQGIIMDIPVHQILVKPISRISSDQITTAWLYSSECLTDFFHDPDAIPQRLLLYLPNYTPPPL